MTLPDERYRAVVYTHDFLRKLLDPKATPRVPKAVRQEARRLLKHYPAEFYMDQAARKAPDVFKKEKA